ncbi:MAG: hypothetical protein E3J21_03735 [Anaerolineales bacterium]|nr:MAG: hypothetical protein E3J21_03735 [Anaerolineales bacterium]
MNRKGHAVAKQVPYKNLIIAFLSLGQLLTMCFCVGAFLFDQPRQPETLVVINQDDPFIAEREEQFNLAQVIQQYDQVILAIEAYQRDNGEFPTDLSQLEPTYLPKEPGIYIRNGERLTYLPEPLADDNAPFTFYIYGHYPGFAFMHGWMLYYCPEHYEGCNSEGDRHFRSFRINQRWIWINRSAL